MTHSALTTGIQLTSDSDSRNGVGVDHFIIHHAATTSLNALLADFAPGGREVSANYGLKDRDLVLAVDEDRRAWTSASSAWDGRSITIEVCNSEAGGSWPVSDATFDTLARLIADCARRYRFPINDDAVLTHQELYTRFGASYATACPGDLERRKPELLALANKYWAQGGSPASKPTPKPKELKVQNYHYADRDARPLSAGQITRLKEKGADRNIIGSGGQYVITPHVKFSGLAEGDALNVRLVFHNTKTKQDSFHYDHQIVAGPDGVAAASPGFIRKVDTKDGPIAVYVEVEADAKNKQAGQLVWIDSDALLLTIG